MLTPDHVNILSTVMASQYDIYLDRDIDLLVDASMKFSVHATTKNIVKHWKNNVDDQLEKMPDEFIRPEDTYLNISQLSDGNYYINGILHKTDGMINKKTLTDIENKHMAQKLQQYVMRSKTAEIYLTCTSSLLPRAKLYNEKRQFD
ncbi:MAG: hypothetical protein V9G25_08235 [Acidimicrobiia bacterium]